MHDKPAIVRNTLLIHILSIDFINLNLKFRKLKYTMTVTVREKLILAARREATVLTANTNLSPINHIHPGILLQGSQSSQNVTNGSLKGCDGTFGS